MPILLEKKDVVGSVVPYYFVASLHTGDTFLLDIQSNPDVQVNYTVYDEGRLIADKRTNSVAAGGKLPFRYVVVD